MPKKVTKSKKISKKTESCYCGKSFFCHPSSWLIAILAIVLIVISCVAVLSARASKLTTIDSAKLKTFDHIAESYIRDMEFTANDKMTEKEITGYGVSNEDGTFYITFDFVTYTSDGYNRVYDPEIRHAIVYFQEDSERNTYGHAYSYHDDANYHPDGVYIKMED